MAQKQSRQAKTVAGNKFIIKHITLHINNTTDNIKKIKTNKRACVIIIEEISIEPIIITDGATISHIHFLKDKNLYICDFATALRATLKFSKKDVFDTSLKKIIHFNNICFMFVQFLKLNLYFKEIIDRI